MHLLFFELELNRLDDAKLEAAMADPALGHYRPWLEDIRKDKPYQLEDRIEQLFHEKSVTGYSAWNRLFDETIARLRFKVRDKSLAIEPTLNLMQDPSADSAQGRVEGAGRRHSRRTCRMFALITNTLAKDKEISDRWRGFNDVAASRHLANRVEPEVVDALVAAVQAAYPRALASLLRAEGHWFGKKRLPHWDRNAPLPKVPTRTIGWAEAQRDRAHRLRRVLAEDGGDRRALLRAQLDRRAGASRQGAGRLRAPDRAVGAPLRAAQLPGQAARRDDAGARAWPRRAPGAGGAERRADGADAADAGRDRERVRRDADLPASCSPMPSTRQRKAMLAAKVEDMINTVVRQIAFYSFERKLHTERRNGELTAERLCEIWMEVQHASLGPAIELKPGYETFWAYIPHFVHSPFYVYAYAFGDCLVNSLYAVYEQAADGFAERYLAMLAAGGTKHHSELLAPFGLDARDPAFWQGGLGVIERMIGELEGLD